MAGIYIHVPFCKQACHYCDFHFSTIRKSKEPLLDAILTELVLRQDYLSNKQVSSIYFGGGTPSLLTPVEVEKILSTIRERYQVSPRVEITLESNPDDLSLDYLRALITSGVNRLSIGIQSFQDSVLRWMNRAHNSVQAFDSVELSRNAGFNNINLDLIYGIPLADYDLHHDLVHVIRLNPDHISAYNLTIEPKTVFGNQLAKGTFQEVPEEVAADGFRTVMDFLKVHGYQHYEISNFSLAGRKSLHNSGYWDGQTYLGVGPSAHSFDGKTRQYNVSNNNLYLRALNNGSVPATIEKLTITQKINETIMLGLRTRKGVNLQLLLDEFKWDLVTHNNRYLKKLVDNGLAEIVKNKLLLTDKGKLVADRIAGDLFVSE